MPPGWEVLGDGPGEWVPVDPATEALLREAQNQGKAILDVAAGGRTYRVTFKERGQAERINMQTKVVRPMRDRLALKEEEAAVGSLVAKGFSEEMVQQAMKAARGDLKKVVELLSAGGAQQYPGPNGQAQGPPPPQGFQPFGQWGPPLGHGPGPLPPGYGGPQPAYGGPPPYGAPPPYGGPPFGVPGYGKGGPQGDAPYGGKGGEAPYGGKGGDVPYGGKGEVPCGGKGEVPYGGKGPQGEAPYGGKGPQGEAPYGGKGGPQWEAPYGGKGGPGDSPYGGNGEFPYGGKGGPQDGVRGGQGLPLNGGKGEAPPGGKGAPGGPGTHGGPQGPQGGPPKAPQGQEAPPDAPSPVAKQKAPQPPPKQPEPVPSKAPAAPKGPADADAAAGRAPGAKADAPPARAQPPPAKADASPTAAAAKAAPSEGRGGPWQVYAQGKWQSLDQNAQQVMNEAVRKGQPQAKLEATGQSYIVDFKQQILLNVHTGRKRHIRYSAEGPAGAASAAKAPAKAQGTEDDMAALNKSCRFQVFVPESGWKMISPADGDSLGQSMRSGQNVFETQMRGGRYRVNVEDGTATNLETGKVSNIRQLEVENTAATRTTANTLRQRKEPVTVPLSRSFKELAGSEASLTKETAIKRWLPTALAETDEKEQGRQLLLAAAQQLFERMALAKPGAEATHAEWIHYWLLWGNAPSSHALGIIQEAVQKSLTKMPMATATLLQLFQEADKDFDGEITPHEMTALCKKYVSKLDRAEGFAGAKSWVKKMEVREQKKHRTEDEGSLNYFEFVSEMVGRAKHEVWVYQYDISGGLASWAAPVALMQNMEGIWHTGVVVFGREYWYGGQCFESKPEETPFGKAMKKTLLGTTVCTRSELWDKINRELCREYTRESYDVLTHNCNNFSDDVTMFLLNSHIPDEVREQPIKFATSMAAQALRPILNQWLGGFDTGAMDHMQEARATDMAMAEQAWQQVRIGSLVSYMREGLPAVTAEVLYKSEEGTCDIWWWEPSPVNLHGNFAEVSGVSKMQVSDLGKHTGRGPSASRRVAASKGAAVTNPGEEGCVIA